MSMVYVFRPETTVGGRMTAGFTGCGLGIGVGCTGLFGCFFFIPLFWRRGATSFLSPRPLDTGRGVSAGARVSSHFAVGSTE